MNYHMYSIRPDLMSELEFYTDVNVCIVSTRLHSNKYICKSLMVLVYVDFHSALTIEQTYSTEVAFMVN